MSTTPKDQRGLARTQLPVRNQIAMRWLSLDQMIDADHLVRTIWAYALSCDLTPLYQDIRAVQGSAGRNPVDPRILFALWLYGTLDGVSSARRLERLTEQSLPYMWLCGEVSVNYHLLADFRALNGELLERLLIDSVTILHKSGVIDLERIAQDGMRVRASAGSNSFRRVKTLAEPHELAKWHVENLRQEQEDNRGPRRRQPGGGKEQRLPKP